jgi:hypothetical protein
MNSKRMLRVCLTMGMLVAFTVLFPSAAAAQGRCETLTGTITAQFQLLDVEPFAAWIGQAYLTFGKDPTVLTARLVDQNNGYKDHPTFKPDLSGNFAGYEILTFTIDSANWFQMSGHFIGIAGTTPYAYQFSEEGKITGGGGDFAAATGTISIHGSFVTGGGIGGPGPTLDTPWVWISEMHGSICGRQ